AAARLPDVGNSSTRRISSPGQSALGTAREDTTYDCGGQETGHDDASTKPWKSSTGKFDASAPRSSGASYGAVIVCASPDHFVSPTESRGRHVSSAEY